MSTSSRAMGWADWRLARRFVIGSFATPLLVASGAEADPGKQPTGAVLVWDPLTDEWGGYVTWFVFGVLAAWDYGPRGSTEVTRFWFAQLPWLSSS